MLQLFAGWRVAVRRFRANWQLMLLVGVGALLATTLLASAPIYTAALSDIGLRFRLERGLDDDRERVAFVSVDDLPLGDPVALAQREGVDAITEARVGRLGDEVLVEDRSAQLGLRFPRNTTVDWPAHAVFLGGFESQVEIVEGRLPEPDAATLEVVLPDGFQREAALGDVLPLRAAPYDDCRRVPSSEDPNVAQTEVGCVPTTFVSTEASATVVGFVRPRDAEDLRWQLFGDGWEVPLEPPVPGIAVQDWQGPVVMLTTREHYFGAFVAALPELTTRHRAGVVADLGGLAVSEVGRTIDDLDAWRADIRDGLGLPAAGPTTLADELRTFRSLQSFSQVPLLLILLQVTGVVAFYVVVLMAGIRERQAEEVAVLRSRGASVPQLLGIAVVEGLIVAVPAALAGPWLASWVVAQLGRTPDFEALTGGATLPTSVTDDAALLAAAGGALVLAAMLLPTLLGSRRAILEAKRAQSRPQRLAAVQRYGLDLAAVALAAVLLWQLDRRGTVFDPDALGGWTADPLLLAAPLVLTVAAAAVVLRVYPLLLRLAARLARRVRGTSLVLGVDRAGREPAAASRLVLLLAMAVAVGTFAASYAPTVERSLEERARYGAGVDLRAEIIDAEWPETATRLEAVRAIDGVEGAALAYRGTLTTARGAQLELLAVDDLDAAARMLWFRDDFAEESAAALLDEIEIGVPAGGGLELPEEAAGFALDVFVELRPRIGRSTARFRDAEGNIFEALLSGMTAGEWTTISAPLPERAVPPLTFVALHLTDLRILVDGDGSLYFDDVAALLPGGERVLLDGFESSFAWAMYSQRAAAESFVISEDVVRSGDRAAQWSWTREISQRQRVLAPVDPAVPLAAIAGGNASALLEAGIDERSVVYLGDGFGVPLIVRAEANLFPTLNPGRGFVVVQLDDLRSAAGVVEARDAGMPNELWVDLDDALPLERQREIEALLADPEASPLPVVRPRLLAASLDAIASDPTLQASGSGILLLAFGAALAAALLGFAVTLATTLRGRVTEFAVLRSLGASPGAILRAAALEWGVVLVLGAALGVVLGRRIAALMLQFLEVTEDGARVVPAFAIETDWALVAGGLAALAFVAVGALWASWRLTIRHSDSNALRLTQ